MGGPEQPKLLHSPHARAETKTEKRRRRERIGSKIAAQQVRGGASREEVDLPPCCLSYKQIPYCVRGAYARKSYRRLGAYPARMHANRVKIEINVPRIAPPISSYLLPVLLIEN